MRRTWMPLLIATAMLIPWSAHAGWYGGPNLGFSHLSPDQGEGANLFGWSGMAFPFAIWQPGLRVGGVLPSGRDEIFSDSGFQYLSFSGSQTTSANTITEFQLSLNYQRDFSKPKTAGPYVNLGAGFQSLGATGSKTVTVGVFGGGLGYAEPVAEGHGRFRFEARIERQGEDKSQGLVAITLYSLRLGFDLMQ